MSTQLAIDTSTSRTSVALIVEGAVKWSEFEDGATAHAEALPRLPSKWHVFADIFCHSVGNPADGEEGRLNV